MGKLHSKNLTSLCRFIHDSHVSVYKHSHYTPRRQTLQGVYKRGIMNLLLHPCRDRICGPCKAAQIKAYHKPSGVPPWINETKPHWLTCLSGGGGGRALLAVPEAAAIQEVSLTVLAMVGYLLLAGKAKLPIVFGAAGLVLELILSGAQSGGAWVWLNRRCVRWTCGCSGRGAGAAAAVRQGGQQMPLVAAAAGRLHRGAFSAARCHRRCRGLCGVQCRHALVRRQHDPRLQRRPRKKIRRFSANPFRDKVTNTANCVILNTIIKIQLERRLYS